VISSSLYLPNRGKGGNPLWRKITPFKATSIFHIQYLPFKKKNYQTHQETGPKEKETIKNISRRYTYYSDHFTVTVINM